MVLETTVKQIGLILSLVQNLDDKQATIRHYHVYAGLYECRPDYNGICKTKEEALVDLVWYVNDICQACEPGTHKGNCYSRDIQKDYIKFSAGHAVEYAEILECNYYGCLRGHEGYLDLPSEIRLTTSILDA